jgi:hypothetical protein
MVEYKVCSRGDDSNPQTHPSCAERDYQEINMFMLFRLHDPRRFAPLKMADQPSPGFHRSRLSRLSRLSNTRLEFIWKLQCKLHVQSLVNRSPVEFMMSMIITAYVCRRQSRKMPSFSLFLHRHISCRAVSSSSTNHHANLPHPCLNI